MYTRSRPLSAALLLTLLATLLFWPGLSRAEVLVAPRSESSPTLPLSFVPNRGQTDPGVRYVAHGLGGMLFFAPREVVLSLPVAALDRASNHKALDPAVLRLSFLGANARPTITASARQAGVVNYVLGTDAAQWQKNLPTYGSLLYRQLYPGVDLRYDGLDGQLKGTYIVAPHAEPSAIRWRYDGATSVKLAADGSLQITQTTAGATIRLSEAAPIAWQEIAGAQRPVAVRYGIAADRSIRFVVGAYDRSQPLIIDPTLAYSTFLGGSSNDFAYDIAVDGSGSMYVAGETASLNFPTASPLQGTKAGGIDAFITKLNSSGALVYSTYLGGSATDRAYGVAVDGSGNAYLAGSTGSTNFPTVNAAQSGNAGLTDAFIAKLNSTGSALLYSTYLGGGNDDYGNDIAVLSGRAYVVGDTTSIDLPTFDGFQMAFGGGSTDAFVVKLDVPGSAFTYLSYLGGNDLDQGKAIAVDSQGRATVTGKTASLNFPTLNPFQASIGGGIDAFLTQLDATGAALSYSSYLGGSNSDEGNGVTLDSLDDAYLTGSTSSANFPTVNPFQSTYAGGIDAILAKVTNSGATVVYSTYLGGSNVDVGQDIAVGEGGSAHVTGYTRSTNYPTVSPLQATLGGNDDVFVSSLNGFGSALTFSSYLGGSSQDWGYGIAVDSSSTLYIAGYTFSSNFPTANPVQPTRAGFADALVAKITP
ncbi:MAG TPA: SBBP repeat-containing protein [Herpetosiphonaceae bacterium]